MTIDIKFNQKQWGHFYFIIHYFYVILYSKMITFKNIIFNFYKNLTCSTRNFISIQTLRMVYCIKLEQQQLQNLSYYPTCWTNWFTDLQAIFLFTAYTYNSLTTFPGLLWSQLEPFRNTLTAPTLGLTYPDSIY